MPATLLRRSAVLAVIAAVACSPAVAATATYVNHAPDVGHASADHDSRITFVLDKGLYGYGHDFGALAACGGPSKACIAFDFMAVRALPDDARIGSTYQEGAYTFTVSRVVKLSLLGRTFSPYRVEVTKGDERANSYLFDARRGVIAIGVANFGTASIPESIFFLSGEKGVLAPAAE